MGSCVCKPSSNKPPPYDVLEEKYSEDSLPDLEYPFDSEEDDTFLSPVQMCEMNFQKMWFWVNGEWLVTNKEGTFSVTKNLENFWEEVQKEYGPHVNKIKLCKRPDIHGESARFYEFIQGERMNLDVYKIFECSVIGVKMV